MYPLIKIGPVSVFSFSIIVSTGFYTCYTYLLLAEPYNWICKRVYTRISVCAIMAGVVGGKLLSILTLFIQDSSRSFSYYILHSGSVYYGILVTGFLTAWIISRRFKLDFFRYSSEVAEVLPLGQAIGRIGCFMNGCCYGKAYEGVGAVSYPVGEGYMKVFPTWFVESAACFILFLLFRRKRFEESRYSFLIYFMVYGSFRFFLEFMRGDTIRGVYGAFSTSQIISIILVLSAFIYSIIKIKDNRRTMQ